MGRRWIALGIMLIFAAAALGALRVADAETPPNIIVIVADDMGYFDSAPYGSTWIKTPNLTALAAAGVRFSNFYSNPICSPTRSSLMTGLYAQRFGFRTNCQATPGSPKGLPLEVATLAQALGDAGYKTFHIGKWHLGNSTQAEHPLNRGYDYFFGSFNISDSHIRLNPTLERNGRVKQYEGHITDILGDGVVKRIRRSRDDATPFFITYWDNSPHSPNFPTAEWLSDYPTATDAGTRYAADITGLDAQLGKILAALTETGQLDDTLIIFMSDNGEAAYVKAALGNGGLRGIKATAFDGGVRVPLIAAWPGHIPSGQVRDQVSHITDLFPTLLEVAGAAPLPTDGRSLLPILQGTELSDRDIFIESRSLDMLSGMYRQNQWKYVTNKGNHYLFDMVQDPLETVNLMETYPDTFNALYQAYWSERLELADLQNSFDSLHSVLPVAEQMFQAQDVIQTPALSVLNVGGWEFSFSTWLRLLPDQSGKRMILSAGKNLRVQINRNNKLKVKWIAPSTGLSTTLAGSQALVAGEWVHVALVMDASPQFNRSGSVTLYVNGEVVASGMRAEEITTLAGFALGNSRSLTNPLMGELRYPRFFNAALLPQDIQTLLLREGEGGVPLPLPEPELPGFRPGNLPPNLPTPANRAALVYVPSVLPFGGPELAGDQNEFGDYGSYIVRMLSLDGLPVSNIMIEDQSYGLSVTPDGLGRVQFPFAEPVVLNLTIYTGGSVLELFVPPLPREADGGWTLTLPVYALDGAVCQAGINGSVPCA